MLCRFWPGGIRTCTCNIRPTHRRGCLRYGGGRQQHALAGTKSRGHSPQRIGVPPAGHQAGQADPDQINRKASQRGRPRHRQLARFQCFIVGRLPGLSQARQGLFCQPTGLPPRSQAFFAPRSCMPRSTKKPVYGPVFYDSHDNFGLKPFIYKRKQLLN